ncbi:MAG: type II toxin-antitoxin system prevent-host-death family antitoxin [Sulfuricaulis sp.]|uniref:type II toxin-antitoxin system Phd/YefM family antitoxin n=1 Tax=Sulfuricaulis sp. TaxID=2003553 RepID=UPI0034A0EBE7
MLKINIQQAKAHLLRYVEEAAQGKEYIIIKAGKPVARIAPLDTSTAKRKLGLLDKESHIPDNFNEPLPDEILAKFLGSK